MYYSATFATFLCLNRDLFVLTVSNNILAPKELSSAFFLQGTQYGQYMNACGWKWGLALVALVAVWLYCCFFVLFGLLSSTNISFFLLCAEAKCYCSGFHLSFYS